MGSSDLFYIISHYSIDRIILKVFGIILVFKFSENKFYLELYLLLIKISGLIVDSYDFIVRRIWCFFFGFNNIL